MIYLLSILFLFASYICSAMEHAKVSETNQLIPPSSFSINSEDDVEGGIVQQQLSQTLMNYHSVVGAIKGQTGVLKQRVSELERRNTCTIATTTACWLLLWLFLGFTTLKAYGAV